jgi:hypothetical protein
MTGAARRHAPCPRFIFRVYARVTRRFERRGGFAALHSPY